MSDITERVDHPFQKDWGACQENERATDIVFLDDKVRAVLVRGFKIDVPLKWYPRLLNGSEEQRSDWSLIDDGHGVHWRLLDEDLCIAGMLRGGPAQLCPEPTNAT